MARTEVQKMSDNIDEANVTADLFLKAALKNQQRKPQRLLLPTGRCFNCEEKCAVRWCNAACRDEWELDQKRGAND